MSIASVTSTLTASTPQTNGKPTVVDITSRHVTSLRLLTYLLTYSMSHVLQSLFVVVSNQNNALNTYLRHYNIISLVQ